MARIVLHQYPAIPGLSSISPFCQKVHYGLHRKGLDYETRDTMFAKQVTASGKLPALDIDGRLVEDSTAIFRALDALVPEPRLYPKDARARALTHVLEDWADETLYWYVVLYRWTRPESFARGRSVYFAEQRQPLRFLAPRVVRRDVAKKLWAVGLGRKADDEVDAELEAHLTALDALVEGGGFVAGEALGAADIAILAQLQMLRTGLTPDQESVIASHAPTSAWIDRVLGLVA